MWSDEKGSEDDICMTDREIYMEISTAPFIERANGPLVVGMYE
jgi:hypothetical protein